MDPTSQTYLDQVSQMSLAQMSLRSHEASDERDESKGLDDQVASGREEDTSGTEGQRCLSVLGRNVAE
jgi:hypothetical protein